jgi:hypothetical protein
VVTVAKTFGDPGPARREVGPTVDEQQVGLVGLAPFSIVQFDALDFGEFVFGAGHNLVLQVAIRFAR